MTTPGFPDWTKPVGLIDTVSTIGASPYTLHNGQAAFLLDTSRIASLIVRIAPPASAAGLKYQFGVVWYEGGLQSAVDVVGFHSLNSYSRSLDTLTWQLPARGQQIDISIKGDNASNVALDLHGSTRDIFDISLDTTGIDTGPLMANLNPGAIAAGGTSATFYIPPVARALRIVSTYNTPDCLVNLDGVVVAGGAMAASRAWRTNHTITPQTWDDILIGSTGTELTVVNNGAGAHAGTVQVWDAS